MFELQTYQPADTWMRRFWSDPFSFFSGSNGMTMFSTDIADNGDSYLLGADLPGFRKEDIHLDLQGDTLTISARRDDEREERKDQYIRCERCSGSYQRSFDMSGVDTDGIHAKYENGVLRLTLPKKAESKSESKTLRIE